MSTQDPIKQDELSRAAHGDKPEKAPERKDEKRELADAEVNAVRGGGNTLNPPPTSGL